MHKGGLCLWRETWCSQHFVLNGVRITDKLEAINPPLLVLLIFIYLFTYLKLFIYWLILQLDTIQMETQQPPFAAGVVERFTPYI